MQASCPGAASMLARVRCALVLDSARGLARQALLEQQQERQRSHAAASTSAASSVDQDAAAVAQLEGVRQADAAAWQRVRHQAEQAVEALQAAEQHGTVDSQTQAAFQELACLLGLQGSDAAAEQLHAALPAESDGGCGDALAAVVFPGAPGTSSELEQAAADAATEGRRSGSAALRRAALHSAAAEAHAAAGNMVPALFHASEAHRLLAVLFQAEEGSSSSGSSTSVGWWHLMGAYLGSLLQLGQLFEAAGLADEALHALRDAQRLVSWQRLKGRRQDDLSCKGIGLLALCSMRLPSHHDFLFSVAAGGGSGRIPSRGSVCSTAGRHLLQARPAVGRSASSGWC